MNCTVICEPHKPVKPTKRKKLFYWFYQLEIRLVQMDLSCCFKSSNDSYNLELLYLDVGKIAFS